MKKTLCLVMLLTLTFIANVQAKMFQVGVAISNFDLDFVSILHKQMAQELEAQGLKGQFSDAKGDVALQVQQVDDFIKQGVDAIILNPVDTQGVLPIISAAKKANIPLVFVNRKPEVKLTGAMAYVGSDSAMSGKMEIEALAKIMNYRGNIAILIGEISTEVARERTRVVEEFVTQHKDMKVVAKQTAKWQRKEAEAVVSSWLQNGKPIDAIVSNNDEMAIGAIMALNQAKKKDVLVAGIDGTPDGLEFIKNGEMQVTIFQDAKGQATGAVKVANALLNKQKTENYVWIPYQIVTKENYQQFVEANQK